MRPHQFFVLLVMAGISTLSACYHHWVTIVWCGFFVVILCADAIVTAIKERR